jgi:THO complex subunit 3
VTLLSNRSTVALCDALFARDNPTNRRLSHLQDDTLIPISVDSPSTPSLLAPVGETPPATTYKALAPHPQPVQTNGTTFSHAFSSDNVDLFLTTGEGMVKIVSYPSFTQLHTLHAHTSACLSLAMSPTSRYLAVGGSDALISLWDTTDWVCKRTVSSSGGGGIRDVSWSWDGRFIVGACDETGCGGSGLEIFHAETGESVFIISTGGSGTVSSGLGVNGISGGGIGSAGSGSGVAVPAVAWHPSRYWLAYSVTADGLGSGVGGLRIVGAAGGDLWDLWERRLA